MGIPKESKPKGNRFELSGKKSLQFFISQKDRFELFLYRSLVGKTSRNVIRLMDEFEDEFPEWGITRPHRYRIIRDLVEEGMLNYTWDNDHARYNKRVRLTEFGAKAGKEKTKEYTEKTAEAKSRIQLLKEWMDMSVVRRMDVEQVANAEIAATIEDDEEQAIQFFMSQGDRLELYLYTELYGTKHLFLHELKHGFDETFGEWTVAKSYFYSCVERLISDGYLKYTVHSERKRQIAITEQGKQRYFEMAKDFEPMISHSYNRIIMLENWLKK